MRRALGRGLEALLPTAGAAPVPPPPPGRTMVALAEITANPEQPRRHFDPTALDALADSIRRHGLLQPLVVRRTGSGYELIAGERRLRASARAGLEQVAVVVRESSDPEERFELALIENLQRENLTPLEEAEAYRHLIDAYGLTQEELSKRVGKSRSAVANSLRLLSLPDAVKVQLESGELSAGHARAVLSVDSEEQVEFARDLVVGKVAKADAERLAAARRSTPARRQAAAVARDPHVHALAEDLTRALGTRVRISTKGKGGSIEIEFYSPSELDRLVERLGGGSGRRNGF